MWGVSRSRAEKARPPISVARRDFCSEGERERSIRLPEPITTEIAGRTNKQDHFESVDGIRKYRILIFDVWAATTTGLGKMERKEKGVFLH